MKSSSRKQQRDAQRRADAVMPGGKLTVRQSESDMVGLIFDREHMAEAQGFAAANGGEKGEAGVQEWIASPGEPYLVIFSLLTDRIPDAPPGATTATFYYRVRDWAEAKNLVLLAHEAQGEAAPGEHTSEWHFFIDDGRSALLQRSLQVVGGATPINQKAN